MHITSQQQLKKQRRKLSLIFTFILFFVVSWIQVLFLIGKYIDYSHKEFLRLEGNLMPRWRMVEMISSWNMMGRIPPTPMFEWEERWRRLRWWNMILYSVAQNRILSSSIGDDDLTQEIVQKLLDEDDKQWSISYNNNMFLFIKQTFTWGNIWLYLIPAQISVANVIRDILLFVLFFWICSIVFYYIIHWFVGKVFLPIQENMQDMEQFIFNAGHELKTPLSVIKSHLQLALIKKQYKKPIDESIKEINKMNSLIESLVNLSTIKIDINKENIEIGQEVDSIVDQYNQIANKHKITIKIKKESEYIVFANRWYVDMLIANLISNAIKYNKPKWNIEVKLSQWELSIKDTWVGIPKKEINKIYDRFYQIWNVRNQEWFGIWLSLVKKIVDMYGWKIEIISEENKGTTIAIKFQ